MKPCSMWTATMPSHPWQWVGGLLIRQGHGARQQQPMIRVPSIFQAGAAAAGDDPLLHPPAARSPRMTMMRFIVSLLLLSFHKDAPGDGKFEEKSAKGEESIRSEA